MGTPCKLLFVLGTRPEAIKLAPVILAAQRDPAFQVVVVSTGQHEELLRPILSFFKIKVNYDLKLMRPGQDLATLSARIGADLTPILVQEKPDWTLVQGDTMTCMAAAHSAFLLHLPVAHVEAGLRTGNLEAPWPEEYNRRVTSLCASMHFAPTAESRQNLLRELIPDDRILVTGNTGIDAQMLVLNRLHTEPAFLAEISATLPKVKAGRKLVLLTVHRREAYGEPLSRILHAVLQIVSARPDVELAIPMHKNPNIRRSVIDILSSKPELQSRLHLLEPLDYVNFLALMEQSTLILTDSGGVQEEAPTLKKPVLVLRETTERDEAVRAGCAKLVGFDEKLIVKTALHLLDDVSAREVMFAQANVFGDGSAAQRILNCFNLARVRKVG